MFNAARQKVQVVMLEFIVGVILAFLVVPGLSDWLFSLGGGGAA